MRYMAIRVDEIGQLVLIHSRTIVPVWCRNSVNTDVMCSETIKIIVSANILLKKFSRLTTASSSGFYPPVLSVKV